MLTRSELPENPVHFAVRGEDGQTLTVSAERLRSGKIRLDCSCQGSAVQGWCRHQVDLLCLRYEGLTERREELELQFEDIVMETPLADLAGEVEAGIGDYVAAVGALRSSPLAALDHDALARVGGLAADLADTAQQLDAAIGRFRKKLAAARQPVVPE